jgi:microcystin-dependent protein
MLVPYNFAPKGYAFCNGQLMAISSNTALFSLLGTFYGGNGTSNFGLPNLMGAHAIGAGQGPGLAPYDLGETGGAPVVTLLQSEMPTHTHGYHVSKVNATLNTPTNNALAKQTGGNIYADKLTPTAQMSAAAVGLTGGSGPHNNMMPFLALNWIIALQGVFPARS